MTLGAQTVAQTFKRNYSYAFALFAAEDTLTHCTVLQRKLFRRIAQVVALAPDDGFVRLGREAAENA